MLAVSVTVQQLPLQAKWPCYVLDEPRASLESNCCR